MTEREYLAKETGTPYAGRRGDEEQRDVFMAELDRSASIYEEGPDSYTGIREPVFTIVGSGESRGDSFGNSDRWHWGVGTNLRVARSSIPALMRVLAALVEVDPSELL